ncbi:hypothetical protein [Sulfurospirillum arcachonense]|uniref:hypothetical protein n=1 Tax=Sulfurospirillum arcachonense TaxID=57666 RepID=UPI0004680F46|nr:hypothetical protein [Sulfurospirillum arcachonense]
MFFIKRILIIFFIFLVIIIGDLVTYDYVEKEDKIKEISSKMTSISPSFSFASKEYKKFVYDK